MTLPRDLIPPSMRATLDAARRMADPFEDVRRQHDMLRASGVLGIAERMKLETPLALAAMGRKLRAASHHAHLFTPEDLKALRLTWNQIETGLIALTPDFELEWTG